MNHKKEIQMKHSMLKKLTPLSLMIALQLNYNYGMEAPECKDTSPGNTDIFLEDQTKQIENTYEMEKSVQHKSLEEAYEYFSKYRSPPEIPTYGNKKHKQQHLLKTDDGRIICLESK